MDKRVIKAMTRTGAFERETPQWVFDFLNDIFDFDVDLCANKRNKKVEKFYSLKKNAFKKKWRGNCWMNPPYGRSQQPCVEKCVKKICVERGFHLDEYWPGIGDWLGRANSQTKKYKNSCVVCLIPVRTSSSWFHFVWKEAQTVCLLYKRLTFGKAASNAIFDNAIAIFSSKPIGKDVCERMTKLGAVIDKKHGLVINSRERV